MMCGGRAGSPEVGVHRALIAFNVAALPCACGAREVALQSDVGSYAAPFDANLPDHHVSGAQGSEVIRLSVSDGSVQFVHRDAMTLSLP